MGLVAVDPGPGEQQLERPAAGRRRPGSVTVRPKPWWKPSWAKLALKRALGRTDAEVGRQRQAESTADGRALHRGHDRRAGAKSRTASS